ncbi:hypothetical protein VaNZ11_016146 [Volvox africanus]|uniref:glycerol kinase n=1 Tax=Volvox africanus TaxID=51714 RepID=A0ABQ5SNQ6_9CHLO|nr:hypothetical protein VaNZ11_016146 [Volvox africanus]
MEFTECIAALDQGTQSTRVFIFDRDCAPIASHQADLPQIYPQAGWCEHDPLEIWRTVLECLSRTWEDAQQRVVSAGRPPLRMMALGITNQRETTVVWSRTTGLPLHNAVVWLDNRTSELCDRLAATHGGRDAFRSVTGLPISPYFSATKYLWMYDNVPEVRAAVDSGDAAVGTIDSWLIWQLTGGPLGGVHITDVTNASRTLLMDLDSLDWHDPTLAAFRCPRAILPRIASNAEVYGLITPTAATAPIYGNASGSSGGFASPIHPLGPLEGVPIAGCLGDQMAAMLGQRCRPGEAKNTYGTGCFMLLNTGQRRIASTHGLLTTVAFKLGPDKRANYALEGSVAVAGLGISWLRDNLGLIGSAAESEVLAASVPNTGGVYFVPAFSGLLAPHWRADARGVLLGMTSFTTRAHVVRAMLEAICFQTREVLDAMRRDAELDEHHGGLAALRVDGGAAANDLLMQLQADLLQVPVVRPAFRETTSLGAALAAGLAVNLWTWEEVFAAAAQPPLRPAHPPHMLAPEGPLPDGPLSHFDTDNGIENGGGNNGRGGGGAAAVPAVAATAFQPAVTPAAASRRYDRWRKAVERALDLADLAPEPGEDEQEYVQQNAVAAK